jgi:hypothetical protein
MPALPSPAPRAERHQPGCRGKEELVFKGLRAQRLLALFASGWLLFNFPLLGLWDRDATLLGIPLFPAALFILWALLIAVLAWQMERPGQTQADD